MRTQSFLLFFLLVSISTFRVFGQVTMTQDDFPTIGDEFVVSVAPNILLADPAKTGANYFWNYSFLKADETYTATFVNPFTASPAFLLPFFDADYGVPGEPLVDLSSFVQFENPHNFYKVTDESVEYLGFGGIYNGIPFPFRWFDSDKLFDLPLKYGDSGRDSSFWLVNIPTVVYLEREQVRDYSVEGWGTLRLPKGDFNVIKVRSYIQPVDTTYIDSIDFGVKITQIPTIRYQWFSPGFPHPLLEIDMSDVIGLPIFSRATFYDGPFVVNLDEDVSTPDLIWTVDQDRDILTLRNKSNAEMKIEVVDLSGKVLLSDRILPGMNSEVNTNQWASGIYFLRYGADENIQSDKILIH